MPVEKMIMPLSTPKEIEMFSFFEMTPDLVCIASKDGHFKKVNKAVINKLGYSEEELFARPITSFMHPEDRELTMLQRAKMIDGEAMVNFHNRYITKDKKIVWLQWTSIYFPDKETVFAIAKDVTERKELEQEIEEQYQKFKNLATHFKSSIERDRKYIAGRLHEELAQLATVVKVDLDWINGNAPELSDAVKSRVNHAMAVSDLVITAVRRISFAASPKMLEDIGLNETLQWLCKEFTMMNDLPCSFENDYDESWLTDEMKFDFFRICQEALSNVMIHAEASSVKITIREKRGKITLSIADDGKGFDVKKQKQRSGITGMRERAASINGDFTINSKILKGTTVSLTVPPYPTDRN